MLSHRVEQHPRIDERGIEMAKENPTKAGTTRRAEKKPVTDKEYSRPKPVSVYLSNKDRNSLEEIAKTYNINRHMLLSYAVRYFLANYRVGHIKLDPTIEAGRVVLNVNIPLDNMDV
jgi:hypothetical protein